LEKKVVNKQDMWIGGSLISRGSLQLSEGHREIDRGLNLKLDVNMGFLGRL